MFFFFHVFSSNHPTLPTKMAYLLQDFYDWYHDLMDNQSGTDVALILCSCCAKKKNFFLLLCLDSRVKDWPMMQSPVPTLLLCLSYAYFCKSLAPRLMENRKPFDLRKTLVVYNLFQTVFSAWIFYEVIKYLKKKFNDNFFIQCIAIFF